MKITLKQALPALVVLAGGLVLIVALKAWRPAPAASTPAPRDPDPVSTPPLPAADRPDDTTAPERAVQPAEEIVPDRGDSPVQVAERSAGLERRIEPGDPPQSAPTTARPVPSTDRSDSGRPLTVYVEQTAGSPAAAPPPTAEAASDTEQRSATERSRRRDPADEPENGGPADVWMAPAAAEYSVGERVSIVIRVSSPSPIAHVPFHVEFDPAVLQFESGEEGSFLAGDGAQTAFFASPGSGGGNVVVGLSRLGKVGGIAGDGELCVLHFNAVGPGEAGLTFAQASTRDASNRPTAGVFRHPVPLIVR